MSPVCFAELWSVYQKFSKVNFKICEHNRHKCGLTKICFRRESIPEHHWWKDRICVEYVRSWIVFLLWSSYFLAFCRLNPPKWSSTRQAELNFFKYRSMRESILLSHISVLSRSAAYLRTYKTVDGHISAQKCSEVLTCIQRMIFLR